MLVVPRPRRKTVKRVDELPDWFAAFGVRVEAFPPRLWAALREHWESWFSDPARTLLAFRVSGGEDDAAWQTAVTYYIAEYWDTQVRGLDSVHFVADIDGRPCFRRNWTSNK